MGDYANAFAYLIFVLRLSDGRVCGAYLWHMGDDMIRFALIPATLALGFALAPTLAHDWYPRPCCSDHDCKPVDCAEVIVAEGIYKWHGLSFPSAKPSQDGGCHVCVNKVLGPLCLFFGGMS